jgi:hypothetical protein
MGKGKIYVAMETGTADIEGQSYVFYAGVTRVREGHPLQVNHPNVFREVEDLVHYEWETATQAPDEKRGAQRGTSSSSEKRGPGVR